MLTTDYALVTDPALRIHTEAFAKDEVIHRAVT